MINIIFIVENLSIYKYKQLSIFMQINEIEDERFCSKYKKIQLYLITLKSKLYAKTNQS